MKAPTATYRIQFNKNFTFNDLKAILPYLKQLGVSHIYASPIFQAKSGSMHGYDITDPNEINAELGGRVAFDSLVREVSALGLGWLQDIVPNHVSYSVENKQIVDIMAKGAGSGYACFFDVNWNYPSPKLRGKLFVPFLAQPLSQCLKERQFTLISNNGFKIGYGGLEYPVNAATQQHLELNGNVQKTLEEYNRNPKLLEPLLVMQYYRFCYWKTALKHISYRRFFDIIDLIGVRMENPEAFEWAHRLIFELADSGMFSGLRVDHIDGLYEPNEYLKQLRERCPAAFLVVEKILTEEEQLPDSWPVEGTTGYDFLNHVNKLFIKSSAEPEIDTLYRDFTGNKQDFSDRLYEAKKTVIEASFGGDVVNLARLLDETLHKSGYTAPHGAGDLKGAVVDLLACFQVYRAYLDEQQLNDLPFRVALGLAEKRSPQLANGFRAIEYLLDEAKNSPETLDALMRFQQYTGAIMAKGFEDTALYRYARLLSLNEVGSNPVHFGVSISEFHTFNRLRQQHWPLTLNATSTHDTKRGEDVRARLNVLSELTDEFRSHVSQWAEFNAPKKRTVSGVVAPDRNEEYYLYQTLLGAYPWSPTEEFSERIQQHMVKALREAKIHTDWLSPNPQYEAAVAAFAAEILESDGFMEKFLPFQQKVASFGYFNSLSQTLLKITCPGVPDFYQGTELWDLNLVDPDNRRPVNFQLRQKLLTEVANLEPSNAPRLLQTPEDGRGKLYVIFKALGFRKEWRLLFEEGEYLPLAAKGVCAENLVAFCRKKDKTYVLTVAPRFPASLLHIGGGGSLESNKTFFVDWKDTYISLPDGAPTRWRDVFTDKTILLSGGQLAVSEVLGGFPVALFLGDGGV